MERLKRFAELINEGCKLAPQSYSAMFEIGWWDTLTTGNLHLKGTSATGAALHAWGFLDKLTTLSNVNAIAYDCATAICPPLFAPLALKCDCGKVVHSLHCQIDHWNCDHKKDRIETARWLWKFDFPADVFRTGSYWDLVIKEQCPVQVTFEETIGLLR